MPRVACFEIPGLTCWFWSNDHDPPHFHVKREGEFELQWGNAPNAKVLRRIAKNVNGKRAQLLAEWEAKVNQ
jgi:Domain of unknown function (DUF4160)